MRWLTITLDSAIIAKCVSFVGVSNVAAEVPLVIDHGTQLLQ